MVKNFFASAQAQWGHVTLTDLAETAKEIHDVQ